VVIAHDAASAMRIFFAFFAASLGVLCVQKLLPQSSPRKGRREREESPAGASEFPTKSGSNSNIVRPATFHPIKLL